MRNLSEMVSGRGCSSVMDDDDDEPDDTWPEIECPACAVVMTGEYTACPYCAADLRAGDALDQSYDIEQAARQVTEGEEGLMTCCGFHNENCVDLEEACCMACPTWTTPHRWLPAWSPGNGNPWTVCGECGCMKTHPGTPKSLGPCPGRRL